MLLSSCGRSCKRSVSRPPSVCPGSANCSRGSLERRFLLSVLPFAAWDAEPFGVLFRYSGIAAIPKGDLDQGDRFCRHRIVRPFRHSLMGLPTSEEDDVGFSPVRFISHCAKAKPPNTWVQPGGRSYWMPQPIPPDEDAERPDASAYSRSLAFPPGRNVIPPSLIRPGPSVAVGCPSVLAAYPAHASSRRIFPNGYGPARVGFGNVLFIVTSLSLTV